jgi:hypothetical protein
MFTCPFAIFLGILITIYSDYNKSLPPIIITALLWIILVYTCLKGGFTDPGILERNINCETQPFKGKIRWVINGHLQIINFCTTCNLFRPPRCSHCAICDDCIKRFDHHCDWLGICIGQRNYKFFYILLSTLIISSFFQIKNEDAKDKFNISLIVCFGFVIFFDCMFVIFFLGKLFSLHTFLVCKNLTFYEYLKKKWNKPPGINPYDYYCGYAFCKLICRKSNKSYLHLNKQDLIEEKNFTNGSNILPTSNSNNRSLNDIGVIKYENKEDKK